MKNTTAIPTDTGNMQSLTTIHDQQHSNPTKSYHTGQDQLNPAPLSRREASSLLASMVVNPSLSPDISVEHGYEKMDKTHRDFLEPLEEEAGSGVVL